MTIDQLMILTCGVLAIWFSQDTRADIRRYACLCGLMSQPFWFYTSFTHEQWGIFISSFLYSAGWIRGFNSYWLQPWLLTRRK